MTLKNRITLIVLGIVIFLIIAPLSVLLARGYYFDWGNFRWIGTGIVSIKSDPRGTEIYLNGKLNDVTPAALRFLRPGEYEIILAKEGYEPWKKRIIVHEHLVTSVPAGPQREVALILKSLVQTALSTTTSDFQETKQGIFFSESGGIFQLDLTNGIKTPAATTTLAQIFEKAERNNSNLFRLTQNALWQNDRVLVSNLPAFNKGEIITSSDNQIFLLLDSDLYQITENLVKLNSNVSYAAWNEEARAIIYGGEHEIWIFDPFQSGKSQLLTRSTKKLGRPVYNPRINYVFVSDAQEIKAIEVDPLGQPNVYPLTKTTRENIKLAVNRDGTHLLYLDGENLYTLKIR